MAQSLNFAKLVHIIDKIEIFIVIKGQIFIIHFDHIWYNGGITLPCVWCSMPGVVGVLIPVGISLAVNTNIAGNFADISLH